MRKMQFGLALAACGLLAITPAVAMAQQKGQKTQAPAVDVTQPASFGSARLSSGFTPDPYRIDIYSGGSIDASTIANGCVGMVARAPDFELTYSAGGLPLIFGVTSEADTTLVINGPDGRWYCDDDSGDGSNPLMRIPNPPSGVYDVYVGAYGGDSGASQLYVTELESNLLGRASSEDPSNSGSSGGALDPFAAANYGSVALQAGFTPDPQVLSLRAGGTVNAQTVSSSCSGFVSRSPDLELSYSPGSLPLIISVDSSADTTLVINGPDGRYYCDDDGGESGGNPSIRFDRPGAGTYDIWVGTYRSGQSQPASLYVSEVNSR